MKIVILVKRNCLLLSIYVYFDVNVIMIIKLNYKYNVSYLWYCIKDFEKKILVKIKFLLYV